MYIDKETQHDGDDVEFLFDLCFAPGRQGLSSYQLRDGIPPVSTLCRVIRDDAGVLIGAIRYWPVCCAGAPALLLGPVAVHPIAQGMGLAHQLIKTTLQDAKADWKRVILIGDEEYYARFGFSRKFTQELHFPEPTNPERFLGLELESGAFEGLHGEIERFDRCVKI